MQESKIEIKFIISLLLKYKEKIIPNVILSFLSFGLYIFIPLIEQKIIDEGLISHNIELLIKLVVFSTALSIIGLFVTFLQIKIQSDVALSVRADLKMRGLKHGLKLKVAEIKKQGLLPLIDDANNDAVNISQICSSEVLSLFTEMFKIVGYMTGLFLLSWKLGLFVLLIIPAKLILASIISKKREKAMNEYIMVAHAMSRWESDYLNGVIEIKNWNMYNSVEQKYQDLVLRREKLQQIMSILSGIDEFVKHSVEKILFAFLYVIAGFLIIDNEFTIGTFIAFITYATNLFYPIDILTGLKILLAEVGPSIKSYSEFLAKEEEVEVYNHIDSPDMGQDESINFQNVSFSYSDAKVLDGLNLRISKYEKTAILGENGSGKSTLANLLLRHYEPTSGTISVDGQNILGLDINEYRDEIAAMSQEVFLFNETIQNNILMFKPGKDHGQPSSKLLSFIDDLPDGLNTVVGDNGSMLSGGQKQRVALARILEKDSRILLLDEATSNIDSLTESVFQELIAQSDYEYVIMITHNIQLIESFDRIVVIKDGKIVSDTKSKSPLDEGEENSYTFSNYDALRYFERNNYESL